MEILALFTFRDEYVDTRRLRVAGGAGVVAGVGDLRLPDDQAALRTGPRGRLDSDVPPGVDVVDQTIVFLPVHVLRWCWTLLEERSWNVFSGTEDCGRCAPTLPNSPSQ